MGAKLTRRRFLRALGTVGVYLTLTNAVGCDLLERTSKLKSLHKPKLTPLRTRKVWSLASGTPVLPKRVWAFRSRPDLGLPPSR